MMSCPRCTELEVKLAASVPRETVGSIMATLQSAQEKAVALIQSERQANLYTAEEAHAILGAFALCFSEGTTHAKSPGAGAAEESIVRALKEQQPDVFAQYAYAFPEVTA